MPTWENSKIYVGIAIHKQYPPPCLSHDVECLRGPCCPREVLLIVLRGFGPPSRDLSGFTGISRIYLRPGLFIKMCINFLTTKMTVKTIPETKKTLNFQNMKVFQNHAIYYGLSISSPPWRHLGHKKRIQTQTHRRTLKFLLILIDFGCSWGVQGWTHEPPFCSHFRLCPFRGTPGGHRVAKRPIRTPKWH